MTCYFICLCFLFGVAFYSTSEMCDSYPVEKCSEKTKKDLKFTSNILFLFSAAFALCFFLFMIAHGKVTTYVGSSVGGTLSNIISVVSKALK